MLAFWFVHIKFARTEERSICSHGDGVVFRLSPPNTNISVRVLLCLSASTRPSSHATVISLCFISSQQTPIRSLCNNFYPSSYLCKRF